MWEVAAGHKTYDNCDVMEKSTKKNSTMITYDNYMDSTGRGFFDIIEMICG